MAFQPVTTYYFERKFKKLTKKDGLLKERIIRKLQEVLNNPDIGEPKRHALRGLRSVHIDPFVVAYVIIKDTVLFLNEYPAACCGWDGQETDLRKTAYLHLDD